LAGFRVGNYWRGYLIVWIIEDTDNVLKIQRFGEGIMVKLAMLNNRTKKCPDGRGNFFVYFFTALS